MFTLQISVNRKIVAREHKSTIHRGVLMTIPNVRSTYWILSLRKLVKSAIRKTYGCKGYTSLPYP